MARKWTCTACLPMLVALVFVASAPPARAQAVYGSIIGTVTDPQGAAVPNAKITVTNVRKGTTDTATTNESGNYNVTHLIPDVYDVKVESQGFKTAQSKGVVVQVDQASAVPVIMQLGQVSEAVEVTAEAPQLKTDRADVATTFNERAVADLPILNRNFTNFELLSPGTQKLVGWSHAANENPQGSNQTFVEGQHFSGTGYELDGTDNQDAILGIIVINPTLESVTETKMMLQNFDPEFGKAIAGLVTASTKSGSNQLHGSAFNYRRDNFGAARDPFAQAKPNPVTGHFLPANMWEQFGGSIGGAIIKNKLFFFGDYQGSRRKAPNTDVLTIPTAQVKNTCTASTGFCDLSQYLIEGQIYNPTTGNPDGTGRQPFTGNLIPVSMLSPQAVKILSMLPTPTSNSLTNNFALSGSGGYDDNQWDTREDWAVSEKMHVFGRLSIARFSLVGAPVFGDAIGGEGFGYNGLAGSSKTHNYSLASGFDYTFSPTLLTDFRFGWFKYNPKTSKPTEGQSTADALGIPNLNQGTDFTSGLPAILFASNGSGANVNGSPTNGTQLGLIAAMGEGLAVGRCNCPLLESEQQFQFVNNWTKIFGNHSIKFGADVRYATNLRVPSDNNRTGELNFDSGGTSDNGSGGLALATFLLGDVTSFNRYASTSTSAAERQKRFFFYGQDTWRVTPKLTLNYGLRWEVYLPETVNAAGNGGFANLQTGFIQVAGYGPFGNNGGVKTDWKHFAPRIGIAYQVTPKTVVRMGYGRSFDIGVFGSNFGHVVTQNLPVLVRQSVVDTQSAGGRTAVFLLGPGTQPTATTSAVGAPPATLPSIPSNGLIPLLGYDSSNPVNTRIRPTYNYLPTVDSWNLTIQHQLTSTMTAEIAYVGNKGTHVFAGNNPDVNANVPSINGYACYNNTCGTPTTARYPYATAFTYTGITDMSTAVAPGTTLVCCGTSTVDWYGTQASANYNALQLKLDKRFSHGIQVLAHYTWAKAMGYINDTGYYSADNAAVYGRDDFNRDHVFVATALFDLPFGRGRAFGGNMSRGLDYIVGGWQVNSTWNVSSGLPWTPSFSNCTQTEDVNVCRPNWSGSGGFSSGVGSFNPNGGSPFVTFFSPTTTMTADCPSTGPCSSPGPNAVLTSGPFSMPAPGTIGNVGMNTFTGPGYFGADASLLKTIPFTERVRAEFRVEFFNVFNHAVLGFNSQQGNHCIDCSVSSGAGQITSLESGTSMRQTQFGLRVIF